MNHAAESARVAAPETDRAESAESASWILTLDHRRLAWMHAVLVGLALVAGSVLAIGLALQPVAGRGAGADAESYRRLYSMHGLVMVFLVALPALPGILGNWLLPERCGVREMAWPRLNLLAFHLLLAGALCFLVVCFASPIDTGWSFSLPLAISSSSSVAWTLLGTVCVATSLAVSGANAVATLVASRAPERPWSDLPFFAWALGAAGLLQVLVTPVLLLTAALLFAQRSGASDFFSASGADVEFDRWFWLWAHPALASMLLCAAGVIGDVIAEHGAGAKRASLASVLAVQAIVALAFAGALVHIAGRADSSASDAASSALALASGVPLAVLVADWAMILASGPVRVTTALGFALGAMLSIVAGGLAGACATALPSGLHLEHTSFAPAQLHFFFVGGMLGALLAGLHQLWPRWFAAPVSEGYGKLSCLLFQAGIFLAFVPPCVQGWLGDPRRSAELATTGGIAELLRWLTLGGDALLAAALILVAWNLSATLLDSRAKLAPPEAP